MNINDKIIHKFISKNKKAKTKSERLMALKLKYADIKFIFQYPFLYNDSFIIVDFYIPRYDVVIEVDGGYHNSKIQSDKDKLRDKFLLKEKYTVIRIKNEDVDVFDTSYIHTIKSKRRSIILKEGERLPERYIENFKYKVKPKKKSKKSISNPRR